MSGSDSVEAARRFAAALDDDDWKTSATCLAPDCVYAFRGGETQGREAIIASYRTIGEWVAETFESVRYESAVEPVGDGRARIAFRDVIEHGGHHLDFHCEQLITAGRSGRIVHIEHVDLPGEPEKAVEFNALCGVKRPGDS